MTIPGPQPDQQLKYADVLRLEAGRGHSFKAGSIFQRGSARRQTEAAGTRIVDGRITTDSGGPGKQAALRGVVDGNGELDLHHALL